MPVNLEIVSPERLLLSRAGGHGGDPGLRRRHGRAGGPRADDRHAARRRSIALYEGEQVTDQMFVAGGFAEVTPERCTVLANEVLAPGELSREEGERRLAAAEAAYGAGRGVGRRGRGTGAGAHAVGAGDDRGGGRAADRPGGSGPLRLHGRSDRPSPRRNSSAAEAPRHRHPSESGRSVANRMHGVETVRTRP